MKTFLRTHRVKLLLGVVALCVISVCSLYLIPLRFDAMAPRARVSEIIVTQMRVTPGVEGGSELLSSDAFTDDREIQAIYDVLSDARFRRKLFQPANTASSLSVDFMEIQLVSDPSPGEDVPGVFRFLIISSDDRDFTHPRPHYDSEVQMTQHWERAEQGAWYRVVGGAKRRAEIYQALREKLTIDN
ncbi:MAG: hypothetical protein LBH86_02055 [Oscillospiraceae bacterium]|jgi:hypothetical protein|nr:hypothetical protein [Oscillospiraceae bacterium]